MHDEKIGGTSSVRNPPTLGAHSPTLLFSISLYSPTLYFKKDFIYSFLGNLILILNENIEKIPRPISCYKFSIKCDYIGLEIKINRKLSREHNIE
jgi:hypothetical protein